jgi:hypothetical protein
MRVVIRMWSRSNDFSRFLALQQLVPTCCDRYYDGNQQDEITFYLFCTIFC